MIVDQGIPVDFRQPGEGNTLIPVEDNPSAWVDSVYVPLMGLWKHDAGHVEFYKNAAISPRLNRIQRYLITSAAYLKEYERIMTREEIQAREDDELVANVVASVKGDKGTLEGILVTGRDGVDNFKFSIFDIPEIFTVPNKGLRGFSALKNRLEDQYGWDAFLQYYLNGNYEEYLAGLFDGLKAAELVDKWIQAVKDSSDSKDEKGARLEHLMERLEKAFEIELDKSEQEKEPDKAANSETGGIDARQIVVERHGQHVMSTVSDPALEDMLTHAPGVRGIIIGVKPIVDMEKFLGISG